MRQRGDRRCLEPTSLDLIMQLIKQKLLAVLMSDFEQRRGSCLILKHKHGIYYHISSFCNVNFPEIGAGKVLARN